MYLKRSSLPAIVAALAVSPISAFSGTIIDSSRRSASSPLRLQPLSYKNFHERLGNYDAVDVGADRMSLRTLLDPPAAPFAPAPAPITTSKDESVTTSLKPIAEAMAAPTRPSRRISSSSRAAQRASPITSLHTIEEYKQHVLDASSNQLSIVRFSAPWCKVCRSTNVSWERLASRIDKMTKTPTPNYDGTMEGEQIKFFSVHISQDEEIIALKDSLHITTVPQGIVHQPKHGVFEEHITLKRENVGTLKKRLEAYVEGGGRMEGSVGFLLEGLIVDDGEDEP